MKRKAFTLVELLVVIAIIALLISILAPSLGTVKDLTKRTIDSSNMYHCQLATATYCEMFKGLLPPNKNSPGTPLVEAYSSNRPYKGRFALDWGDGWTPGRGYVTATNYGALYKGAAVGSAGIFYCPCNPNGAESKYRPFSAYTGGWDAQPYVFPDGAYEGTTRTDYGFNENFRLKGKIPDGTQILAYKTLTEYAVDRPLSIEMFGEAVVDPATGALMTVYHTTPVWEWGMVFRDGHTERKASKVVQTLMSQYQVGDYNIDQFQILLDALLRGN